MKLEILHHPPQQARGKPPLLFVHGVCHGAWCWEEKFLPYFANKGWDAYAVSLRGHAGSEGREQLDTFGLQDYVDDVFAAAAQIGARPVVIGHSMGGGITQLALRRAPEKLMGAVLFASMPPGYLRPGDEPLMPLTAAGMLATQKLLQQEMLSIDEILSLPFFDERISREQAQRYGELLQTESMQARADIQKMNTAAGPAPLPLLVMGSRHDSIFGEAAVRRTAAHYEVEAVVVGEGCHDLMLDPAWQTSAAVVLDWLEQNF
jgi:pimeloyl-ACP methyl ester carboxylesterase